MMDLRWLSAPEFEVAAAIDRARRGSRPRWMPTARQLIVHVNHCLMLWYLCIVWFTLGVRIDTLQENRITAVDVRDIVILTVVFLIWCAGALLLWRWSKLPPSRRSRLASWRQTLTSLANGFEPQPTRRARFRSLITTGVAATYFHPRFVAGDVEFGQLRAKRASSDDWHYLMLRLPAPVPHVVLSSVKSGGISKQLPVHLEQSQRISLEGDFDRHFRVYAPNDYGTDALYLLAPDVMVALLDHAVAFNVEMVDDTVVFFAPGSADFTRAETWERFGVLITCAVPVVSRAAARYRDDRVPGQGDPTARTSFRATMADPTVTWVEPKRKIDSAGRRLKMRDRRVGFLSLVGALGWCATLVFLYVVPGLFAFAGFMSIIDGH
ncbi:hypothetical protein ACIPV2_04945 [Microbacterium sp. NPDC089987]|uniref:hypothetical protein n=1 Tax=Microbacterium sp. NPDC089987 TaxID=3364202 RepID=UPI00380C0CBE